MKFVYVLTGNNSMYFSITVISALFLRRLHPEAEIILLTDCPTAKQLKTKQEISVFSGFEAVDTPYPDPLYSSRYIRCNMRKIIKGDFVYLDSDTLPKKRLDELFKINADIACALNHNTGIFDPASEPENGALLSFGWNLNTKRYLNAGVQFWKDSAAACELADTWLSYWLLFSKTRSHHDQIAFNAAVCSTDDACLCLLDDGYNLQTKACSSAKKTESAYLWHYYVSDSRVSGFIERYLAILQKEKTLGDEFIDMELKKTVPIDFPPQLDNARIKAMVYGEEIVMPMREKMLNELAMLGTCEKAAVFGTGLSGSMTYDELTKYFPDMSYIFIDDNRTEPFRGIPVVTTERFLSDMQSTCCAVVCGSRQKLNPVLEKLTIPLVRLGYVE